jgi:hypothetical protein
MNLTSYERVRRFLAGEGSAALTDNVNNRRDILFWIASISGKIERYLNRSFLIQSRTEYFDVTNGLIQYWLEAPPVISITSVNVDSTGLFTGGESELDDSEYYIGSQTDSIVLVSPESWAGKRGLKVVYTGGLCYSAVNSIYAVTPNTTAWTVGNFCIGGTSQAVGIIRAASLTSMTIEVLYGLFEVGETLTEYTGEDKSGATAKTATLDSKTQTSLAESYPDICLGCDMEIRYLAKHRHDYENAGTNKDGTTLRRGASVDRRLPLQPEVIDVIDPYRRIAL